ncbi:hypothetical protein ACFVKB_49585 [Rhodococcus sp. NPDC127530]|uniref:hypothetical protein n=1 Tax=unclassified Rhodococcus (in: high G+C Gram-positive bacteria) TaxID=192944 RepID=UPI00363DA465
MGGVTYDISHTRFEATRELLARFAEGHTPGVANSLTHDGARHHLFITPRGADHTGGMTHPRLSSHDGFPH